MEVIITSYEAKRTFAFANISLGMKWNIVKQQFDEREMKDKARSTVSLRDIQHV